MDFAGFSLFILINAYLSGGCRYWFLAGLCTVNGSIVWRED